MKKLFFLIFISFPFIVRSQSDSLLNIKIKTLTAHGLSVLDSSLTCLQKSDSFYTECVNARLIGKYRNSEKLYQLSDEYEEKAKQYKVQAEEDIREIRRIQEIVRNRKRFISTL